MIKLNIPGRGSLALENLMLDFNGTLALGGRLLPEVSQLLHQLASHLRIYVVTADSHGTVAEETASLPVTLLPVKEGAEAEGKLAHLQSLGAAGTAAMGNGSNDRLLLQEAALGIMVLGEEGAAGCLCAAADLIVRDYREGLRLFLVPDAIRSTLRS